MVTVNSTTYPSTEPVPFADGALGWVRATVDTVINETKFYTSTDGETWTQLGLTKTDSVVVPGITIATAQVGAYNSGSGGLNFVGDIWRAQVFDTIDGTAPVLDFNPPDWLTGSTWVSKETGNTWTNVGAATFSNETDSWS